MGFFLGASTSFLLGLESSCFGHQVRFNFLAPASFLFSSESSLFSQAVCFFFDSDPSLVLGLKASGFLTQMRFYFGSPASLLISPLPDFLGGFARLFFSLCFLFAYAGFGFRPSCHLCLNALTLFFLRLAERHDFCADSLFLFS
jgi:hypothetical protein